MRTISYASYFDKVYGCFLGKCLGGTAGGPAEGRKELLDFPLAEHMLHVALPNDDLDLQILWLEVLQEKGPRITARDLGQAFADLVPYGPGEYGTFGRNFKSGVYPPYSGRFNNVYYANGMGCPIRSEIWACLFPGAYDSARPYVEMDGCQDHVRDSIDAEHFLSCLESEAFFDSNIVSLIRTAMARVPMGEKLAGVISDTLALYEAGKDWRYTRSYILRHYGHADCTNLYQNIGFGLLSLLYGESDMRKTIQLGIACGYDTDCICATAASVIGILRGASTLLGEDGFDDTGLEIGVRCKRENGSIADLAKDVAAAGVDLCSRLGAQVIITDTPDHLPTLPADRIPDAFALQVDYPEDPALDLTHRTPVTITLISHLPTVTKATLTITPPEGILVSADAFVLNVEPESPVMVAIEAWVDPTSAVMNRINRFEMTVCGGGHTICDDFGLIGGMVWQDYGPYLANVCDLTHLCSPETKYGAYFTPTEELAGFDLVREYHLGGVANIDTAFADESAPFTSIAPDGSAFSEPITLCTPTDLFAMEDLVSHQGPQVHYLVSRWIVDEDTEIEMAVGHTAPFKLWFNGSLVGGDGNCRWWTMENRHIPLLLKKGVNTFILKVALPSGIGSYSLIPRYAPNGRLRQREKMAYLIPRQE